MLEIVKSQLLGVACLACAFVCTASATAFAQTDRDEEARRLFEAGNVAFADGTFEAALSLWQRSYELSERPQLLYNIGTAADRLRRNEVALEAFRGYLGALPDASNASEVRRRVEVLEAEVARDQQLQQLQQQQQQQQQQQTQTQDSRNVQQDVPPPEEILAPPPEETSRGWIGGVVAGAVVVVATAIILGVVLSGGEDLPRNDVVIQTLGSGR